MTLRADLSKSLGHHPRVMTGAEPYLLDGESASSLVLVHGWGGSPQSMRLVAERVARTGMRVVVPRLNGHATVPADLETVTAVDWLDQISAIVARLARAGPVSIAGCSLGATLSLATAGIHPQHIRAVTTINGGIAVRRPDFIADALLDPRGVALNADEFGPMTLDPDAFEIGYDQVALPRASFLQALAVAALVRELAPRIVAPTLLLHSRQDQVIPFDNAERLHALLTSAPVRIVALENSLHAAQVDYDADVIADAIIEHQHECGILTKAG